MSGIQDPRSSTATRFGSPEFLEMLFAVGFLVYVCGLEVWLFKVLGIGRLPHPGFALAGYLLVFGSAQLLPDRWRWPSLAAIVSSLALLFTVDDVYFRFFGTLPTVQSGIPVSQVWAVRDSVVALLRPMDVVWWIIAGLFWPAAVTTIRARRRAGPVARDLRRRLLIGAGFLVLAGLGLGLALNTPLPKTTHLLDQREQVSPLVHWNAACSNLDAASFFGVAMYHIRDLQHYFNALGKMKQLSDDDRRMVQRELARSGEINRQPGPFHGIAKGRNVVVVLLESTQFFLVDLEIGGEEVTPFLNRLYRESLHWNRFFDNTGLGRTSDAEFSLHAGIDPDEGHAVAFQQLNDTLGYLPRVLADHGYESFSFHGFRKDFWNRANTHRTFGFDHLYFEEELPTGRELAIGLADEVVFPAFADRLATASQPFYGFMITLSGHHPFNRVPEELQDSFPLSCGEEADMLRGYLQLANYVDGQLERFVQRMIELGLAENTLFVFFGDHDLGTLVPGKAPEVWRRFFAVLSSCFGANPFAPQEDRTPLCILIPGCEAEIAPRAHEFEDVVGCSSDIFPTLFDLLGLAVPDSVQGRQLFHPGGHLVNLSNYYNPLDRQVYQRCVTDDGVYLLKSEGWQRSGVISFDGRISALSSAAEYDNLRAAAFEKRLVADYLRRNGTANLTIGGSAN